jgi:hypothetical protein
MEKMSFLPENPHPGANVVTESQVIAAMKTAGLLPTAAPSAIAAGLSNQFALMKRYYPSIPLDIEPMSHAVELYAARA